MTAENLNLSRDFFYLAICCFGFSIGYVITLFTSRLTLKLRNWTICGAILWFSGMIAFLTPSIIFSQGTIFLSKSFIIVGIIIFVLALISCRFPKYVGLPLILAAGIVVVIFSFSFLRFPLIRDASFLASETDRLVFRLNESNQAAVRILRSSDENPSTEFALFEPLNWEDSLSILAYDFYIDEAVPFAGGQIRSTAAKIMQNNTVIYTNPLISRIPFQNFFKDKAQKPFVFIEEYQRNVAIEELKDITF